MSDFKQVKELRSKREKLVADAGKLLKDAAAEKRELSGEENSKFEAMHSDADKLKGQIDRLEKQLEAEQVEAREIAIKATKKTVSEDEVRDSAEGKKAEYREVFNKYIRGQASEMELRALATSSGSGVLTPDVENNQWYATLKEQGTVRSLATVWQTSRGGTMPVPLMDDSSNAGELIDENTQATTDTSPTVAAKNLNEYKFSSKQIPISHELLEDTTFDILGYIGQIAAERIGTRQNYYFVNGTGSSQPTGLLASSGGAGDSGVAVASNVAITHSELVNIVHSLGVQYRRGASILCHDDVIKLVRKMTDTNGDPLWRSGGLEAGEPDRIMGYPVYSDPDVPAIDNGSKSLLFGNFKNYVIRDTGGFRLKRFVELKGDYDQVVFVGFHRTDAVLTNPASVKYVTFNSSSSSSSSG